jgi:chemotaxis signal transduction protein
VQDSNIGNNYITGIIKIEERLIILIDIFNIVGKDDMSKINGRLEKK